MQKRFVSWTAVSSLPQAKKISLADQAKTNQEHIERWNGILVETLTVPGESRSVSTWEDACRKMDAYARLRDLIERRAFDVLIYLDRSRLGRIASLSMTVAQLCQDAGIILYPTESPPSSLEPQGRNFANKVVGALESVLAQEEVTKIQARHEMGMAARVRNGDFPATIPYGWKVRYEVDEGKPVRIIEVDEDAKQVIEKIIELYLYHGYSLRDIGEHLHANGYPPPRSGKWKQSPVQVLMRSMWRYAGYVELNRRSPKRPYIRAKSKWPALISEEDARAVIAEQQRRAVSKRSANRQVRFSHLVWCKQCGRRMRGRNTHHRLRTDPGRKIWTAMFSCVNNDSRANHPLNHVSLNFITEALRAAIEYVKDEKNRTAILKENPDKTGTARGNVKKAKDRLAKLDESLQRADDAYVIGRMTMERYQRQVDGLQEQRDKVLAELARHEAELEAQLFDSQLAERLDEISTVGLAMLESDDLPTANAWFLNHFRVWVQNDVPEERLVVEYI